MEKAKLGGATKAIVWFCIGAVLSGYLVSRQFLGLTAAVSSTAILETAMDGRLLMTGRQEEVLERYDQVMPQFIQRVENFDRKYLSEKEYHSTLWAIQAYDEVREQLQLAPEVQAVLDALPPRPPSSCAQKRLEEAGPVSSDEESTAGASQH